MASLLQLKLPLVSVFLEEFYLADILDIVIVAFLLYWLIVLLKNSRYHFVFAGLATLAVVYFAAVFLDLRLTRSAFEAFFGVFILAAVIIFQDELRRFFELVAFWTGSWRRKALKPAATFVDEIVQAVEEMTNSKIGMIIVIRGRETLVRYLRGGYYLNGEISDALLFSIFDSSSLGHDGAVIIEGDRVVRFGVHLPLSENSAQLRRRGTRHSAALGITERSDALAIVVSEERGKISVARDGKVKIVDSAAELKSKIEAFLKEKFVGDKKGYSKRFLVASYREKVLAAGLAILLWTILIYI